MYIVGLFFLKDAVVLFYDFDLKMTKSMSLDGESVDITDYNNVRY